MLLIKAEFKRVGKYTIKYLGWMKKSVYGRRKSVYGLNHFQFLVLVGES